MTENQTPETKLDETIADEELESETQEPTAPSRRDKFIAALKLTALIGGTVAIAAAAASTAETLTNRGLDALTRDDEDDDCGCPMLELEISSSDDSDEPLIKELETDISIDE